MLLKSVCPQRLLAVKLEAQAANFTRDIAVARERASLVQAANHVLALTYNISIITIKPLYKKIFYDLQFACFDHFTFTNSIFNRATIAKCSSDTSACIVKRKSG